MNSRQLLLAVAAVLTIFVFFSIPVYHTWKENRLDGTMNNFTEDLDHLDLEDRMLKRWGNPYQLSVFVKQRMKQLVSDTTGVLLVPPADAIKRHLGEALPEPVVVYFYAGIRTVSPENAGIDKAAYAMLLKDQYMTILKINGPVMRKQILEVYKTY